MTLRTITFDDSTHKLVPLEPTVEMMTGCFDGISLSDAHSPYGVEDHVYSKMIAAAPECQEGSFLVQFAWFIPACGMFTRSKDECDKWVSKGHKVLPLHVIPEPYQETKKDE